MPLEALRYPITPLGLHYLLIHFDIPLVDAATYWLAVAGHVDKPLRLTLEDLKSRPATTLAVTLECAGNGRARLSPRPLSQPWLGEAVGTAEWTGTRLAPVLQEAGLKKGALEVVFTGLDRGVQGGIEQFYERSLSVADATHDDVLLVYAINGQALPPQSWRRWSARWDATRPGEYELCVRATDASGNVQPLEQSWNLEGVQNNAVQRVRVVVGAPDGRQIAADLR